MLLELSSDQDFFRETTAKFLKEKVPVGELRRLRDDATGYGADYWRQGAELGWTSLLVSEEHGGGTISGSGLVDLTVVAHEFGRHAAPGPLVPTNVVAGALSAAGAHEELLGELVAGTAIASWCLAEGPPAGLGDIALEISTDGDELVLTGVKRPVESAAEASHLLVVGRTGDGLTQVLVPTDTPGITITPMQGVDLTRRFAVVTFDSVRVPASAAVGQVGKADGDVERQLHHALVLTNAQSVGAMQTTFDITVEWASDRYSFGRPLSSYQALKHRFAAMKSWLEGSHGVSDEAAAAVAEGKPNAVTLTSAAKAFIGDYGAELMQDCVQLHGGIGVTFEHDLHLYFRRHTADRALYGTPAEHRQRITDHLEQREELA